MWSSTQILQGNLVGLSFPSSEGTMAFYFGLCYFIDCSLERAVFFLFFLFLPPSFGVYYAEFIVVVGRVVDSVEGSTNNWAMWPLSCCTTALDITPIIPSACALGCWFAGALELWRALGMTSDKVPDYEYIKSKCWAWRMDWSSVTTPPKVTSLEILGSRDLENQSTNR